MSYRPAWKGKEAKRNRQLCGQTHLSVCIEMISYDFYESFNINRILMISVGLWPYNQSKLTRIQIIMCWSIMASFAVIQLTAFLTSECTPDFVIVVFSNALASFANIVIYNSFVIKNNKVRYLLEQLQGICNDITDKNEIAIIRDYGINAKRDTTRIILCGVIFLAAAQILWLRYIGIFDIFLSENELEGHRSQYIVTEYFFDQEKYFYLIILHMDAMILVSILATLATGTTILACSRHICGMLKIASYRFEQTMVANMQYNINLVNMIMIYKNIVRAIDIHRKAIMFATFIRKTFDSQFCILVIILVCGMSLNLYRIFQIMSFENDRMKLIFHLGYVFAILLYLLIGNYSAQQVTDHNDDVYVAVYNTCWYIAPLHIQKLILLLLQKGSKPFILCFGKIFVASLECFAMLVSASISYFTVMYSTQQ